MTALSGVAIVVSSDIVSSAEKLSLFAMIGVESNILIQTQKLAMACPKCGSGAIVFSCEPKCCFNHVCEECTTSFQPVTEATGEKLRGLKPPDPQPDCTEPATACAKCESIAVYALADGRLVCTDCGAVLKLEYTEVA